MAVIYGFFRSKGPLVMGNSSKPGRPKTALYRLLPQYHALDNQQMLTAQDMAHYLDVSEKTAYRWIQADQVTDRDRLRLLAILALGDLPWKGWEHWRCEPSTGRLIAPNGYGFMPGELAWFSLIKEHNRELQKKVARLQEENEYLRIALEESESQNATKPAPLAPVVRFPGGSGND